MPDRSREMQLFHQRARLLALDLEARGCPPRVTAHSLLLVGMYLGTDHADVASEIVGRFLAALSTEDVAAFVADAASLLPPAEARRG